MVVITFNIQMKQVSTASLALMPEYAVRAVQENMDSTMKRAKVKRAHAKIAPLDIFKEIGHHLYVVHVL